MSKNTVKYFCGSIELCVIHSIKNGNFKSIGGKFNKHNYDDSFSRLVGHPIVGSDAILPITRKIFYKKQPSLHVCDHRCRSAKGHSCECSCGGQFHGIDS